jgi:cell division transport system permease protein
MTRRARVVPLAAGGAVRYLPWTIGVMVFLAVLALAGSLLVAEGTGVWRQGLTGTLTVQVLPAPEGAAPVAPGDLERRTLKVLALLRATPGVARAEELSDARIKRLLEPWLGPAAAIGELPMPRLIDVALAEGAPVDAASLRQRLTGAVIGVVLEDHGSWLQGLLSLVRAVELLAAGMVALIVISAIATAVFTTRTGLSVHADVIELLHLIGAQDGYIARRFQTHALALGLKGAVVGFAIAAATLFALDKMAARLDGALVIDLSLGPVQWGVLAATPLVMALIVALAARVTVMRALGAMM